MLDEKGFDIWAPDYDASVRQTEDAGSYPFAGYRAVLGAIYDRVTARPGARVLDLGFGTGTLTGALYRAGCEVFGQDFSPRMTALAQEKMPDARLYTGDFASGLVPELAALRYDFVVATYSLHHLELEGKIRLLRQLCALLRPGGAVLVGDVAFETDAEQDACRVQAGDEWDDEEHYFVAQTLRAAFPELRFTALSPCAGVLEFGATTAEP